MTFTTEIPSYLCTLVPSQEQTLNALLDPELDDYMVCSIQPENIVFIIDLEKLEKHETCTVMTWNCGSTMELTIPG